MPEIIRRQKAEGGRVCVVSHSYARYIVRDYEAAGLPVPDLTLGWEVGAENQKPSPAPIHRIMDSFGYELKDILVVDDLKPGYTMARAAGCDIAVAMWGHEDELAQLVRQDCPDACFVNTPEALKNLLFY
ncbi:MAG: hypothetical protein MJ136_00265 [Clostridia bacterium]|nr:hypothetical protein [Clostridia bacterium]